MEHLLLPAWRGRRVLLAGGEDSMTQTMHALLTDIGARPAYLPILSDNETFYRLLTAGPGNCVIAPDLNALAAQPPAKRLTAIQALLCEAHETGVPLTMLLAVREDVSTASGQALSHLAAHAQSAACAHRHDALSLQWIWREGVSAHQDCLRALSLGACYLMGDHSRLGFFTLNDAAT